MKINKTYKYKLKLTKTQESMVTSWIHTCRCVYNLSLETKIWAYKTHKKSLSSYDLQKQLTILKKEDGYEWMKEVPSQTLQNAIERMDSAYKGFFRGGGFPKFANKYKYSSILLKSVELDENKNRFLLPKLGSVNFFNSRQVEGDLKRATITKENNGFFISILTEQNIDINLVEYNSDSQAVGIDTGVKYFAVSSDGEFVENPQFTKTNKQSMRVLQRKLARQKKKSNNWCKTKKKISNLHRKTRNQRMDFLHKTANLFLEQYDFISAEKLQLKNMTKSAKGNTENPGKNVKQKAGLNRAILDLGLGYFYNILQYKSQWQGKTFVQVPPQYTSQTCSKCGHIDKNNRLSQSKFVCLNCGHEQNADENAAINIMREGISHFSKREAVACA